jgi:hypothetical protein
VELCSYRFLSDSGNEKTLFSAKPLQGEVYAQNKQFGEGLPNTAGSALYGKLGFEASYKKFSLGSEVMLPCIPILAGGDIEAKSRFSVPEYWNITDLVKLNIFLAD